MYIQIYFGIFIDLLTGNLSTDLSILIRDSIDSRCTFSLTCRATIVAMIVARLLKVDTSERFA